MTPGCWRCSSFFKKGALVCKKNPSKNKCDKCAHDKAPCSLAKPPLKCKIEVSVDEEDELASDASTTVQAIRPRRSKRSAKVPKVSAKPKVRLPRAFTPEYFDGEHSPTGSEEPFSKESVEQARHAAKVKLDVATAALRSARQVHMVLKQEFEFWDGELKGVSDSTSKNDAKD